MGNSLFTINITVVNVQGQCNSVFLQKVGDDKQLKGPESAGEGDFIFDENDPMTEMLNLCYSGEFGTDTVDYINANEKLVQLLGRKLPSDPKEIDQEWLEELNKKDLTQIYTELNNL